MTPDEQITAGQLELALRTYRERVERNGGSVTTVVRGLESMALFCVTRGQGVSSFDADRVTLNPAPVTARLLTYKATAEVLACSESTVKRLVASQDLPVVHIGNAARIRVCDLDEYVARLGQTLEPIGAA